MGKNTGLRLVEYLLHERTQIESEVSSMSSFTTLVLNMAVRYFLTENKNNYSKRRHSCITGHYMDHRWDCGSLLMRGGCHQPLILIWLSELIGGGGEKMTLSLVLEIVACYATIANTEGNQTHWAWDYFFHWEQVVSDPLSHNIKCTRHTWVHTLFSHLYCHYHLFSLCCL